jgi:hypothetical protein
MTILGNAYAETRFDPVLPEIFRNAEHEFEKLSIETAH